ncbi:MAG: hypothetical protein LBS25_01540 [Candidatus Symbiothrix sp.]|jgi:hypothetical protein|nr:hypothetical protein [Candidatus Symbiothrix sp.]
MTVKQLHKRFITDRTPYFLAIVLFIVIRLLWCENILDIRIWLAAALQIGIALSLLLLNQIYNLIRKRTVLPAFFFLLFVGTNPLYFNDIKGSIVSLAVIIAWYFLLKTYQNPQSQREAFNISLCISLGAVYWPPLLSLFPLFWYGMSRMRSFNWKTFLANLFGFILIEICMFTWALYFDDWSMFTEQKAALRDLVVIQPIPFDLFLLIRFLVLISAMILAEINIVATGISEKVFAKITFGYWFVCALPTAFCYFFLSQWQVEWGLISNLPCAFLLSHYFTMSQRKWQSWLFFAIVLFFLLFLISFW